MTYLNIRYTTGEYNRILCSESDAARSVRELANSPFVALVWID